MEALDVVEYLRARLANAQAAVDEHSRLILATEVGNNARDNQRLIPVIEAVARNTGATPDMILADAGYASEANFEALEQRQVQACVSVAQRNANTPRQVPDTPPSSDAAHGTTPCHA